MKKNEIFALMLALVALTFCGQTFAHALSPKETAEIKKQIVKTQSEIGELEKKLLYTPAGRDRDNLIKKIYTFQLNISELNEKIRPKPKTKKPAKVTTEKRTLPSDESIFPIDGEGKTGITFETSGERRFADAKFELGLATGFLGNTTAFLGEIRVPLRYVFGPAKTSFRISSGFAQNMEANRKLLPACFDLILNFPPGFFTGTQNYLGFGVNYLVLTSGNTTGTFGGELFYGVEGEGFGGMVFGEVGYAVIRTGFSASQKGATVLIGYRLPIEF